jgi:hypothetical protein
MDRRDPGQHSGDSAAVRHPLVPDPSPEAGTATPHRRPRWAVLGAVIACSLIASATVALTLWPRTDTPPAVPQQAGVNASVSAGIEPATTAGTGAATMPAADLTRIADHLVAAPYEAHSGTYQYTDTRIWETDTTAEPGTPPASAARPAGSVRRIRSWTDTRGSGRAYWVNEAHGCPPETDESWTGQVSPWDGPLSSDPDAVLRQLLGPPPNDGIDLFGQIGELFAARIVPLATRRGLLRILARQPHIAVSDGAFDPSGRIGIAVTNTKAVPAPPPNTPFRETLIFDPATGDLLAAGTTDAAITTTPDPAVAPWQRPGFLGYTLYLARSYTDSLHAPAPDCTGPEPTAPTAR